MNGDEVQNWLMKESQASEPMNETRTTELSRADAKRLAEEMAALLDLAEVGQERKYREYMLTSNARMEVKLDSQGAKLDAHIALDEARHTTVTQEIDSNKNWINKGIGLLLAIMAMLGFMTWLIDKVRT